MDDLMNEWSNQAKKKLDSEAKAGKYDRYAAAMKSAVHDALVSFCEQDEEFAQAIVQGGTFEDCMKAVAKNCGNAISDLEAYRRAVRFYFEGADVQFQMKIELVPGGEEMREEPAETGAVTKRAVNVVLADFL